MGESYSRPPDDLQDTIDGDPRDIDNAGRKPAGDIPVESAAGPEPSGAGEKAAAAKPSSARREHTRKTLMIYAFLMAAFVLVLILISYLNQIRAEGLVSETLAKLTTSEQYADGIEKNIILVQQENLTLKKQLAAASASYAELEAAYDVALADISRLEGDLVALRAEKAAAEAAALAEEIARQAIILDYIELTMKYDQKDYAACREIISKMEANGAASKLPEAYLGKYMEIIEQTD